MGVPRFPKSAPASDLAQQELSDALPEGVMASDYQWLSLKSWNPDARVSRLDGSLVVDFTDYHDPERRMLGFAGGDDPGSIAAQLMEHLRANSRTPELHLVDETAAARLPDTFTCEPDRDHADYVYSTSELVELVGSGHQVARRQLRRFERVHGATARVDLVEAADAPWSDLVEVTEKWAANSARPDEATEEVNALARCARVSMSTPSSTPVWVAILTVDDAVVGFDVSEVTQEGWAILHFRHNPRELVGAYGFLRGHMARHLADAGVAEWNFEQDLGLPGLRTRKLRDRPSRFVRKYRVAPVR